MPPLSPTAIGPDLQTQVGLDGLWANLELMAATTEEPLPLGGRVSTVIVSRSSLRRTRGPYHRRPSFTRRTLQHRGMGRGGSKLLGASPPYRLGLHDAGVVRMAQ
jgi:hypothetical protein